MRRGDSAGWICRGEDEGNVRGADRRHGRIAPMRPVIVSPGEDGFWVAECPSLPGCISQGQTRTDAITNIREAIEAYVAVLEEDGLDVPEERFDVWSGR